MKNIKAIVMVLALLSLAMTSFAAGGSNESDPNMITFDLGTTIAASGTESSIFRIPKAAKIDSIYLTDLSGITANSTDYCEVKLYRNNAAYGTYTSSGTALVAVTPKAITPTANLLSAGDVLQFKLTKTGSGVATTNLGVTVAYHNTDSK